MSTVNGRIILGKSGCLLKLNEILVLESSFFPEDFIIKREKCKNIIWKKECLCSAVVGSIGSVTSFLCVHLVSAEIYRQFIASSITEEELMLSNLGNNDDVFVYISSLVDISNRSSKLLFSEISRQLSKYNRVIKSIFAVPGTIQGKKFAERNGFHYLSRDYRNKYPIYGNSDSRWFANMKQYCVEQYAVSKREKVL